MQEGIETKERIPSVESDSNTEQQEVFQRAFEKPNSSWPEVEKFANQ